MDYVIRSFNRRLFLVVALAMAGCAMEVSETGEEEEVESEPQALTDADVAWWRGLSQAYRNQIILDRTARDIGRNVGVQCKPWVQRVVADASRGVATVPLTAPDAYGWYWQYGRYATRVYANIRSVQPGWIVQMNIRFANGRIGPHTAIVVGVSANGVYWVESNYDPLKPNTVNTRFQTFADFEQKTYINGQYRYSLYYINGG